MALVKVATLAQLQSEPLLEVTVNGNVYAVCMVDGQVHAIDGTCPHQGGPLGQGMLNGAKIMCPWHAWEFDCISGTNDVEPDEKVTVFPVKVDGQEVFIDIA